MRNVNVTVMDHAWRSRLRLKNTNFALFEANFIDRDEQVIWILLDKYLYNFINFFKYTLMDFFEITY